MSGKFVGRWVEGMEGRKFGGRWERKEVIAEVEIVISGIILKSCRSRR